MQAVLLEREKKVLWDRFIDTSPSVIAWHSFDYADVLKRHYGLEFYPLAVLAGSSVCGVLPLYLINRFRTGRTLMSVPYFVAGGIVAESAEARQVLLSKAIELGNQLKADSITLRQYKIKIQGPLVTDSTYYNRELTLSRDLNQVWNSLSEANRVKIEEAQKQDTVLEYPSDDLQSFYNLLLHDQHMSGLPCVSRNWIERLQGTAMYKIALLKRNGEVVAGTMAKTFKDTVSFPFTSLRRDDEAVELLAYQLYWSLIEHFAQSGIRIFHSGRIPTGEQVPAYRLGWGGTKCNYYYQYYRNGLSENHTAKTPSANTRGKKRETFQAVWKKIPIRLARAIGPVVVRQFP